MINIIKIDAENNYFLDGSDNIITRYSEDIKSLVINIDGSILTVEKSQINLINGQIIVDLGNDRYIIDDGFQNSLIRTGYIVYHDYDEKMITDKQFGTKLRSKILNEAFEAAKAMYYDEDENYPIEKLDVEKTNFSSTQVTFVFGNYKYIATIESLNSIVTKNKQRKFDKLPFYPYVKDMDKFGTVYLSIFCEKIEDKEDTPEKYRNAEKFIEKLLENLNKLHEKGTTYKFKHVEVKRKLCYVKGV